MATLTEIVREEVNKYAAQGRGANILLFPLLDDLHQTYAVNAVDYPTRKNVAGVVVLARILGDKVVIEEDSTNKPLLDALLDRGVAREQVILAYAGEAVPQSS